MRHGDKINNLSRTASHRSALLSNLAAFVGETYYDIIESSIDVSIPICIYFHYSFFCSSFCAVWFLLCFRHYSLFEVIFCLKLAPPFYYNVKDPVTYIKY